MSDDEFKERLVETMPHLRAFARSLARDHATADGIVQDTLLKAWAARDSYIPTKPMQAWTFVILRNTFYSRFRRQKFTGEYSEETAEQLLTVDPAQEDPLHVADLHDALMELTESQREAIILVGAGGFSYQEAADIVGCAEGTIKSRVSRAREGLVVILQRKFASRKNKSAKLSGSAAYEKIIEAVDSYTKAD
ncbi:MAG: sigma-70 family RNA polymerase sigma factor [Pseudomonadota bacterium]